MGSASQNDTDTALLEIIAFLHARTAHDFKPYKQGTMRRRIERRMAMAGLKTMGDYLDALRFDPTECDLLAKDLLINVTNFFRDPKSFAFLTREVIPSLVRDQRPDPSLRI